MKWDKKGLIYSPNSHLWWSKTHAYLPTIDIMDSTIRVYYSSRDIQQIGRIGYVELNPKSFEKILKTTNEPILDKGGFGTFDEFGVNPCCIITKDSKKLLYYFGWQKSISSSYSIFCGLAISDDGGISFRRYSKAPILDRTDREPFLRSSVSIIEDNGIYRMWYVSGDGWTDFNFKPCPTYVIRYAESKNGFLWNSTDKICITPKSLGEFGFGRPWVIKDTDHYKMWYSVRTKSKPYFIGYAESFDGLEWTRNDDIVGIHRSEDGWDSEMICFACVFDLFGDRHMLYNGNKHGIDGFGYAKLMK
jgi:predicted GH43/DUF377 family glycosyl hydrolase